jgi:transcriptional regulator with XRE-family HTH domain
MESLGKRLQQEREKKGISLKDISLQTKIGLRHLESIENDRIDLLPGGFFTKQILKSYLSFIGVDFSEWLVKYQEAGLLPTEAPVTEPIKTTPRTKSPDLEKIIWISLTVIVLILFVLLIYLSIKTSQKTIEARKSRQEASAAMVIATEQVPPQPEPEASRPAPAVQEDEGLNLDLTFNEDCWIQVYSDGNLVVDGLKLEGFKTSVKAESELIINLGNAGGISFTLNGKEGKPLGKRGAVVKNIKITRDNLEQYLLQAKPPE